MEAHRYGVNAVGAGRHPASSIRHRTQLGVGQLIERITAGAGLDLDSDELPIHPHQEINLTAADAQVASDEASTAPTEKGEGDVLADSA